MVTIKTKYGNIENVPLIRWIQFQPYWTETVRAFTDIVTENRFRPYPATTSKPDGIVASTEFWNLYGSKNFIFTEALKFVELLKSNESFQVSISLFNRTSETDWLDPRNIPLLGGRVYGFYYTLRPILHRTRDKDGYWIKIKYKKYKK